MSKVGYVSVTNHNYGSILQSFALQQYLFRKGIDNEVINYKKKGIINQIRRLSNIPLVKAKIGVIRKKIHTEINSDLKIILGEREKAFAKFVKENLVYSEQIIGRKALEEKSTKYKAFILGSDQVWNPMNIGTDFYTMTFVPKELIKVTYASSFGVSKIPNSQKYITKKFLRNINYISVRETSGKSIIKDLLNKDVPVVVDPTLLFNGHEWSDLIADSKVVDYKYIFCYFVGNNPEHRHKVLELSKKTGLKLVYIPHVDEYVKSDNKFLDKKMGAVGPGEFINLIRYASYVCTDSFHATIFSIQFHKKFLVFDRFNENQLGNMNGRLSSILNLLGLTERRISSNEKSYLTWFNDDIDYSSTDEKLNLLRSVSYKYLDDIISVLKSQL